MSRVAGGRLALLVLVVLLSWAPRGGAAAPPLENGDARIASLLERAENGRIPAARRLAAARAVLAKTDEGRRPVTAGRAHLAAGQVLFSRERFGEALAEFHAAARLLEGTGSEWHLSRAFRRLGDTQYRLGSYELAVASYLESLETLERTGETEDPRTVRLARGHLYLVLGNTLRAVGDTVQAMNDYRKAGEVYRTEGYEMGVAGVELSIANLLADRDHDGEAVVRLREALGIAEGLDNPGFERLVLTNLAGCEIGIGNLDEAKSLLERAGAIVRREGGKRAGANVALKWGDLLMARHRPREAARRYREAVRLGRSVDDSALEAEANGLLADALIAAGRRAEALEPLLEQRRLVMEGQARSTPSRVASLRIAYDAERQEQELRLLQAQRAAQLRNNRALLAALGFTSVLFLGTVWALRAKARLAGMVARQHRELQDSYSTLERISRTDELTGLPNRRHALERLDEERGRLKRGGRPFCLALADLDGFKGINDRWGHAWGDRVLREVARTLTRETRTQDLVARWGGDELFFLLPETPLGAGTGILQRILDAVSGLRIAAEGKTIGVTLSIGVTYCAEGTVDEWLRMADEALYRAKAGGGRRLESSGGTGGEEAEHMAPDGPHPVN